MPYDLIVVESDLKEVGVPGWFNGLVRPSQFRELRSVVMDQLSYPSGVRSAFRFRAYRPLCAWFRLRPRILPPGYLGFTGDGTVAVVGSRL